MISPAPAGASSRTAIRAHRRPLVPVLGLAVAACTAEGTMQGVPRELVLKTAHECQSEFPGIQVTGFDRFGQVEFTYRTDTERDGFTACLEDRAPRRIESAMEDVARGHPVAAPDGIREASIPVQIRGNLILLPATANGEQRLTLLLDTGAAKTILRPGVATRLGIAPSASAPRWPSVLADGRVVVIPYMRLRSIALGGLVVEDLDVGVYEVLRDLGPVDGILGADLLGHFRVSIDRKTERVDLVIRPE